MPVLNEERYLTDAVTAILQQRCDDPLEVVLALGPSTDDTDAVARRLAAADSRVVLVTNPSGLTPDGLNAAIAAAHGDVIVRVDAHSELPAHYIATAVQILQETGADNVGGVMAAKGVTPFEIAVATAMTSPFGVGAASFHVGGNAGPADTVYLGVFRRSALERVGGYDPHYQRAQDWEMNLRIRHSGGVVWFDPRLQVTYRPRPSLRRLARQYFDYGSWRREVMREHPESARTISALRYFAPPVAVLGTLVGLIATAMGFTPAAVLPLGYLAIEGVAVVTLATKAGRAWFWLPIVLVTMHWSWGIGFLASRRKRLSR